MDETADWRISEVPFTSQTPIIGPLVVRFRTAWNQISTRWYVLPLVQQSNLIFERVQLRFAHFTEWLAMVDRDQVETRRALAEAQLQIAQLERRLQALEAQSLASSVDEAPQP